MSKVTGLLNFLAQAPGQVFGGLLGPSPLSPGMANQLPQGFDDQARKQAIQQMAIAAMSAPRGQQLAQATQAGQTGYRSSLVDMLRMQEMERMQGERKAEADRVARLRGEDPRFANLSAPTIEQILVNSMKPGESGRYERGLTKEESEALGLPQVAPGKAYVGEFTFGGSLPVNIKEIGSASGSGSDGINMREQKIRDLQNLHGLSRAEAIKYVDNYIGITNPDASGRVFSVDRVGGTAKVVGGPPNPNAGASSIVAAQDRVSAIKSIEPLMQRSLQAIKDGGVGSFSAVKQLANNLGSIVGQNWFAENAANRRQVTLLIQQMRELFTANKGRIPVQELQNLQELMEDFSPSNFLTNTEKAATSLGLFAERMDEILGSSQKMIEGGADPVIDIRAAAEAEMRRRGIQ